MNDKQKQQLMVALVVFNFTVVAYVLYRFLTAPRMVMDVGTLLFAILIGAGIGLVNGAIGYRWNKDRIVTSLKLTNIANQEIQQHIFGDILRRQVVGEVRVTF